MRWIDSARQSYAIDDQPAQAETSRAEDAKAVWQAAKKLRAMVESVNRDEFYWQEAHYDRDSKQGRELLFLMANHEWVRATSEIVDITRSDAIETTIKIDIDLSQITHEAFRNRKGHVWLPVSVLPPQIGQIRFEPDLFATVTDAAGNALPMLPAADLRHQVSAAMAEIIAKMAVSHLPRPTEGHPGADPGARPAQQQAEAHSQPIATRDQRLVLSAAIYRMLRSEPGDDVGSTQPTSVIKTPRITRARAELLVILDYYIDRLERRFRAPEREAGSAGATVGGLREHQFTPELAHRAIQILQALADSVLIVVRMDYVVAPAVLTVRVPTRKLNAPYSSWIRPWTWFIKPFGRLEIDMLQPTADADRQIQVNLPDGVSLVQPDRTASHTRRREFPHLDIAVHAPLPLQDLSASMEQVFGSEESNWPVGLTDSFVDLAWVKSAIALDTLRHYKASYQSRRRRWWQFGRRNDEVAKPTAILEDLIVELKYQGGTDHAIHAERRKIWESFTAGKLMLYRRTATEYLRPHSVVGRTDMIEDVEQRATPQRATMSIDVTIDDRNYFSSARSSAFMSLLLMIGVLSFLVGWHLANPKAMSPMPEVLAIVLTLFATIQADRIERPDRSTLRGRLFTIGNWLVAASVLPALTLAIALAFQPRGRTAYFWAGACIFAQLIMLALMRRGPLTPRGRPSRRKHRILNTDKLDYRHFEALRSDYWRNTTADALMIGRKAYGYVVWQKANPHKDAESMSPKLRPLLSWENKPSAESSSVLALLRSGTLRQAVTFVVFRGEPDKDWPADIDDHKLPENQRRKPVFARLDLDPGRLAPADSVTSMIDVFVGVSRREILAIKEHPVTVILQAAANKLIVLDVQLPIPAPVPTGNDRLWARIRVALRDSADIRRLTSFLAEVHEKMTPGNNAGHVVAVQTVPDARPRIIVGPGTTLTAPPQAEDSSIPVDTDDLDIVNRLAIEGERRDARTWRVLAICADARSNIESDIIQQLADVRESYSLAGFTYALLHGTAVMVLFVHEPRADRDTGALIGQVPQQERHSATTLEADLQANPALPKLRVLANRQLSRDELEPVQDHPYPLLRVRFRWQDRPGAFLNVLNSISDTLSKELPSLKGKDYWSVSYARVQVVTGQIALGRLTIRMHIPAEKIASWTTTTMEEMGRRIEERAAGEAGRREAVGLADDELSKPEEPVIGIYRMTRPAG